MDVRQALPEDAEAVVALRHSVFPYLVVTPAEVRYRLTQAAPEERTASYVATAGAEVIGWASAGLIVGSSEPGAAYVWVLVRPDHRGQGIGRRLATLAQDHLRAAGAQRIRVWAMPESLDFALRRGYQETRRVRFAVLDPRHLPERPEVPEGLRLAHFAGLDPRQVYEAEVIAQRDKPGDTRIDAFGYEQWLRSTWQAPGLALDISTAALDGDQVVCFTRAVGDRSRIWSAMTGTGPAYRGRGLAKLVKWTALHRAAEVGVTGAYTASYDSNQSMIAVNTWLGYRPVATQANLIRTL